MNINRFGQVCAILGTLTIGGAILSKGWPRVVISQGLGKGINDRTVLPGQEKERQEYKDKDLQLKRFAETPIL